MPTMCSNHHFLTGRMPTLRPSHLFLAGRMPTMMMSSVTSMMMKNLKDLTRMKIQRILMSSTVNQKRKSKIKLLLALHLLHREDAYNTMYNLLLSTVYTLHYMVKVSDGGYASNDM